ncbi:hypothetical protein D9M69_335370 [compost metagenome]
MGLMRLNSEKNASNTSRNPESRHRYAALLRKPIILNQHTLYLPLNYRRKGVPQ